MFVRLTRPARAKAGWFAALLYLCCVLAPGVALALGDAASCLMHQRAATAAAHVDTGDQADATAHRHHDRHAMHGADADHALPAPAGHQHDGKGNTGPCCAMLCVSAIATDLPAIAKPVLPISSCVSENFRRLPGAAPPLLFRPPIA
jgi:hypothetical protein